MRGDIKVEGGKIRKTATITDNAEVKHDLRILKLAIQDGALDQVLSLKTYDVIDLGREDEVKHAHHRPMTLSEIDKHIKKLRQEKIDSIEFALYQMNLFSKYLKKNVHASGKDGYTAEMILISIDRQELGILVQTVLDEFEASRTNFIEGKYNNIYGLPETRLDHIVARIANKAYEKKMF